MLPHARRSHTRTACVPCRDSKIKCDGATPICSGCKTKGRECRFQEVDDKRRLTLRVAMELLCSRIEQLCCFIGENALQPPPMDEEDHATLLKVLGHQRIPYTTLSKDLQPTESPERDSNSRSPLVEKPASTGSRPQLQQIGTNSSLASVEVKNDSMEPLSAFHPVNESNLTPDGPNFDGWLGTGSQGLEQLPHDPWGVGNGHLPEQGFSGPGNEPGPFSSAELDSASLQSGRTFPEETQSEADSTEALVNQLSERFGSLHIGPGGHIRYLGPTSNFSLIRMPFPDILAVNRTIRNDGQDCLERLGIGKPVPPDLEEHLASLYFAWQDPALHVVNRHMYESAKARWRSKEETPYYSESLQNAICAIGAAFETRHHPTLVTFPRSLADFFADRAKALLEIELDSPCVATVQAMAVLSSHDIGCKRDSRGWLYSGMAMRLALDLGLHMDMTLHVTEGILSQAEAELRGEVFWGAYIIDHSWGFYLGKPARTHTEDITIAKPRAEPYPSFIGQWFPYNNAGFPQATVSFPDGIYQVHRQRVMMTEIMARVANAVYGDFNIPCKTLQEMNAETVAKLMHWKASLPPTLQVNEDDQQARPLPHVLLLHMHYYQNIIHAHRPYMSKTYHQPFPPQGPGSDHARMMCTDSAFSIAKLLQLYEASYGLRRINVQAVGIACSAALLLIFTNITRHQPDGGRTEMHLNACFRALDEFSLSWDSAKRARELLLVLQRQWELKGRSARAARRASIFAHDSESVSAKRCRTSYPETLQTEAVDTQSFLPGQESDQLQDQQGPIDINMGLDLDWMIAGFPFAAPQYQFGRL